MNDPLYRWLITLGRYLDANVVAVGEGWIIDGTSDAWRKFREDITVPDEEKERQLLIVPEPRGHDQWLDHLRIVERAAARQLTLAPVGFTATFPTTPKQRRTKIVRFAFGLSLSLGRRLRQRFTAYVHIGEKRHFLAAGDDELFTLDPTIGPLDVKREEFCNALPVLLSVADEAQETYGSDVRVLEELERLRKTYEQEFQSLDTLYTINSGRDARLLGIESQDRRGEDAMEAEYVARLEDLEERYRPSVILEPLTLGIVEGWSNAHSPWSISK